MASINQPYLQLHDHFFQLGILLEFQLLSLLTGIIPFTGLILFFIHLGLAKAVNEYKYVGSYNIITVLAKIAQRVILY